jgi:beta-lactamase class C
LWRAPAGARSSAIAFVSSKSAVQIRAAIHFAFTNSANLGLMRSESIGVTNWRRRGAILAAAIVIVGAALAIVAPGSSARPSMSTEVRSVIARDIDPMAAANGGVAVAVRMNGRTLFFNYGYADQVEKRPITSDVLFNIGSVRKIFEATLLAEGAQRGELSLDDPVNKYVTELHGDYISRVTIGQLATHTSGLSLPTDHPPWPTQHYSLAGFYDALNAFAPHDGEEPGKQHIYSHAGYILLQLALERRYSKPISALIESGVTKPLGMKSTIVPERGAGGRAMMSAELLARTVQGYSQSGLPIGLPGDQQGYFDFSGTGQMFSTARDLSILLAACLDDGAVDPQVWDALQMTQREAFRVGPQAGQAMAWETIGTDGPTIVDKPGGLNNASAYIGLVPERKIGIIILANRGDVHPFEAARSTILPALSRMWVSGL